MDLSQLEKVRPCGRLETYSTARHYLGFYNNVGLTATYTTPSDSDMPLQNLIFAALHQVIAEHSNLSVIPANEDRSYPHVYLARIPEIDLRNCVEFHTRNKPIPRGDEADPELDKLLRSHHSRNFESDIPTPYWRLAITAFPGDHVRFTASWIFHHALSDGASSMLFHESFLRGINDLSRAPQANIETLVSTPLTTLAPPLEKLHSMTLSWSFFLSAVAGALLPGYFKPRPQGLWTGSSIAPAPVPSNNLSVVLSAETTKRFATLCRKQETSVTAALSTLLSAALFHTVDLPHDQIRIDTPISLRPFIATQEKTMVNAITNSTSTFDRTPVTIDQATPGTNIGPLGAHFSWATARRVKCDLVQAVEKKGADNPIALLKYVSNMHDYFTEKLGTQRETSAEVSNLGVYRPQLPPSEGTADAERNDTWSIGRMLFSQSANHTGPQVGLGAVTGSDECLVLSFNLPLDLDGGDGVGQSFQKVPDLIKQGIEDLVRQDGFD